MAQLILTLSTVILVTFGTGLTFPAIIITSAFMLLLGAHMQELYLVIILFLFSGVIVGRSVLYFTSVLFRQKPPESFIALAVVIGLLAALESSNFQLILSILNSNAASVTAPIIIATIGDLAMSAAIISLTALVFISLIELPFFIVFRGTKRHSFSWIKSLRPICLIFFLGFSFTQIGVYFNETLSESISTITNKVD